MTSALGLNMQAPFYSTPSAPCPLAPPSSSTSSAPFSGSHPSPLPQFHFSRPPPSSCLSSTTSSWLAAT